MGPHLYAIITIATILTLWLIWNNRSRRPPEEGYKFVYINQNGSARELTDDEQAYLETDFRGDDGGRPYVKFSYGCKDGWGSISGFIERRKVPAKIRIVDVVRSTPPDKDTTIEDMVADAHAVGDLVEYGDDSSIKITPNPKMNRRKRFRLLTERYFQRQQEREARMMNLSTQDSDKQSTSL